METPSTKTSEHRRIVAGQLAMVLVAWIYLCGLHWQNDGLWFQGDAPRHAANGLFWKDFLLSGSLNAQEYALGYYARYPVIAPAPYPPAFYMLEALTFWIFHPAPRLALGLVLLFALLTALYLLAWLRRWIGTDAGWMAPLVLLLPGFIRYSHVIMLNVPATALSLGALYHARRWIEDPPGSGAQRQLYIAAALCVLATLTYFPAGIVVLIIASWVLAVRRWTLLWNRKVLFLGLVCACVVLPCLLVAWYWAPLHVSFVLTGYRSLGAISSWTFYGKQLPILMNPYLLIVAAAGLGAGMAFRRWRRETLFLSLILVAGYASLSALAAKEARYALLLCVPVVGFCSIAFHTFAEELGKRIRLGKRLHQGLALILPLGVCAIQAYVGAQTPVPRVEGIRDVVRFIERSAPAEAVLYDGNYDGIFTFYIQAGDPGYRRRVVLGSKLLYASAMNPTGRYQSFVSSVKDLIVVLQTRGGCRWLAIEIGEDHRRVPAARLLREAVQGPEFELIRSFPVSGPGLRRIDVYKFKLTIEPTDEADLPFPILGAGTKLMARPIQR